NELATVTGTRELRFQEVDPSQFYGIEIKPWAREIAELTLWIGFHQFWRRTHGDVQPEEPILRDTGTLENRDAVLVSEGEKRDPSRDRPDPLPCLRHPVTGELVPDPAAKLEYREVINPHEARWPAAEFIIGNPPYLGKGRQRDAFGDGYVDALRAAYPTLPDGADFVMYWWYKAAKEVAAGRTFRAGLITTQSITQAQNRAVIAAAAANGAQVCWAIPDHYWNDGSEDARVRVAMTVIAKNPPAATLVIVDGDAKVVSTAVVPRLNMDLSAHADVASAVGVPLQANEGLAACGFMLAGAGFILEAAEAKQVLTDAPRYAKVVRPYVKGGELTGRPKDLYVIDFGLLAEVEARNYPLAFDIIRDRVKPDRDANNDAGRRASWWRFGRTNERLRTALDGLPRYIATTETAKHRMFTFLDASVAADHMVICVASDDAFLLGILSSLMHTNWALAAGSQLGIDGTPRYNKGPCFEAFPFPDASPEQRAKISAIAEKIDTHRKAALARSDKVGMTVMYNVVDRLRAGTALSKAEREVHQLAACGTLRDLHDELDQAVAEAYGWPWPLTPALILDRLVALHDERVEEERRGLVRWLRPDYQVPRFGKPTEATQEGAEPSEKTEEASAGPVAPWPSNAIGQISALLTLVAAGPVTVEEAARHFNGAKREIVQRHLEMLAIVGDLHTIGDGHYAAPAVVG
ncbi:MAG: DNA methyltransferase, partial [Minicystis sp.]